MLGEIRKGQYSPYDPYMRQTPVKDIADLTYEEIENEEIQIYHLSQFDYEKLRDKRQIPISTIKTTTETYIIPTVPTDPTSPTVLMTVSEQVPEKLPTPESEPNPSQESDTAEIKEHFLVPLYVITAFFAFMLFIVPFFVRRGPNRGIVQCSIRLSAFCMWIFWFTIYFGQMHPLMGPRLENTTVAWIAYKLGNPIGNYTS